MRALVHFAALGICCAGCETTLATHLDESAVHEVLSTLSESGIGARTEPSRGARNRFTIQVPSTEATRARAILADRGVPREVEPGFAEVFADHRLIPTRAEEQGRHQAAVSGELARTLETWPGVTQARVHLAVPYRSHFELDEEAPPARASVLLVREGATEIDAAAVQALVSGAVLGLSTDAIEVIEEIARPPEAVAAGLTLVGPFSVAEASAGPLRVTLAVALALNLGLALSVLGWVRRRRHAP